jgi:metal-responsive CopG/Arc/MetJ family transcriptional regulator
MILANVSIIKINGGIAMRPETIRYTATLPLACVDKLKEMAKEKKIPSVSYAINEALDEYLKNRKSTQYADMMREAGRDKAFIARTVSCAEDFSAADGEVFGTW